MTDSLRHGQASQPQRRPGRRWRWSWLPVLILAACDADRLTVSTGQARDARLSTGTYAYRTWSDAHGGRAWWGDVELRVGSDGRISGSYRLPWQCSDGWGIEADCVGRVTGRALRDGTVRFGLDEGWITHDGSVGRWSEVRGRWRARFVGYADTGPFELVPH